MTQTTGGVNLPRTYLAEGCQASLDRQWDVKRTPGSQPGAELPFRELLQQQLKRHVCLTFTLQYYFSDRFISVTCQNCLVLYNLLLTITNKLINHATLLFTTMT